ncbi:MAG TPA: cytochrome P450 [Azospirillaceae bacterium]|nr:cytochrome P450 [Azospirillaceae bacterium]
MLTSLRRTVLGELPAFRPDPLRWVEERLLGNDRPLPVRLGPGNAVFIARPSAFRQVLVDEVETFGKGALQARMRPAFGDGLITASGARWQAARHAAKASFSHAELNAGMELAQLVLAEETGRLAMRGDAPLSLHAWMGRLTLRMVVAALFRVRMEDDAAERLYQAGQVVHTRFSHAMWRIVDLDATLPTPENRRFKAALRTFEAFIDQVASPPQGVLKALAPLAEEFGPQVLRDEAMTMMIAGFETTATVAAMLAYELADKPWISEWLRPEIDAAANGFELSTERFRDMPRTRSFVQEVLRLYPSTWWFARVADRDTEIDGVPVRKGTSVLLCPWALHRQEDLWEDARRLDPARFLGRKAPDKFAYVPFGAGPRTCVGAQLATAELMGIAAMLVGAFEVQPLSGPVDRLGLRGDVTLALPAGGLDVRLNLRAPVRKVA